MSLKPRERIILLAAILGIAAAAMIWSFLSGQEGEAQAQTQVVTAADHIPSGMVLTAAKLQIRSFPKHLVPPSTAASEELVIGKIAKVDIRAGQPISLSNLAAKDRLSYVVPAHMRAVTVALDPVIGVGGFLKPSDRVDVVATFEMNGNSFAKTVLQNVRLLAIGTESEEGGDLAGDKATAKAQPTATLAVSPNDAEKLILADAKGRLRLTLRSADDESVRPMKSVSAQAVMGIAPPKQNQAAAAIRPTPTPQPANLIRGLDYLAETLKPAPVMVRPDPLPRTAPAAESSGKTIVIVRGTQTSETVVPE